MPSQKQLKWSQLRVGLTVLFASITLGVLTFLMSGTSGLFTPKLTLHSYFDNAGGLRDGAPVRLQGVDVGNVTNVRVVGDKPLTPVEVTVKVTSRYRAMIKKDSVTSLSTVGVLGETYIDIDSSHAKGPQISDGDTLATRETPDIQDVVRASQGTLQNLDALLKRTDRILAFVESGQGSIGKLIYDPNLYNQFAATVNEFKGIVDQIRNGEGSLGKLVSDDEAYNKVIAAVDKLNAIVDDLQQGKGTAGKFLKDPGLYNNANDTIANVKKLTDDINAGKGTLGKLTKDDALAQKLDNTITKLSMLTDQMLIETRQLVKSIRENPKQYLTFKVKVF